jgi:predicted RNase H-like nuclease (RuvC/YqgF family)
MVKVEEIRKELKGDNKELKEDNKELKKSNEELKHGQETLKVDNKELKKSNEELKHGQETLKVDNKELKNRLRDHDEQARLRALIEMDLRCNNIRKSLLILNRGRSSMLAESSSSMAFWTLLFHPLNRPATSWASTSFLITPISLLTTSSPPSIKVSTCVSWLK